MEKSTLESLPNELLLIIFSYLSPFDLCQTFLNVKNVRIERLLTTRSHWLDVSSMHYIQLRQFLSSSDDDLTNRFTTLIETVVLRDSFACMMLLGDWKKTFNDGELSKMWLPSIKHLLILNGDYYVFGFVHTILSPLTFRSTSLQRLHIIFERPARNYSILLSQLVDCCISVHTMILEVEKGMPENLLQKRTTSDRRFAFYRKNKLEPREI
jgi:hypothetical protein